ncbi:MAG: hypothetical protein JSU70_01925 [Phycisphaerales bacterium]|nr:MAG: hypothetical protein JSU70_01925 [Phycisphaerales bacterium]
MALMEANWHPDDKQLRTFGIVGLIASVVLSLVFYLLKGIAIQWVAVILGAGAAIFLLSLISGKLTRMVYVGLMAAALPIGYVVSFILLAAFYFILLTPLAIFFKIIGRDPLGRKFDSATDSYWLPHRAPEKSDRYFQQF